jgi:hypothetical protein
MDTTRVDVTLPHYDLLTINTSTLQHILHSYVRCDAILHPQSHVASTIVLQIGRLVRVPEVLPDSSCRTVKH